LKKILSWIIFPFKWLVEKLFNLLKEPPKSLKHIGRWIYKASWALSLAILVVVLVPGFLYFVYFKTYRVIDRMVFPVVSEQIIDDVRVAKKKIAVYEKDGLTENEKVLVGRQKGWVLARALTYQLERELDSSMGWSVNDLWITPTKWTDDRRNRQMGVLYGTRMLEDCFSTNLGKLGPVDAENEHLRKCRESYLSFEPKAWGWYILYPAESKYRAAIREIRAYADELLNGQAVYNLRTDDIYTVFSYITGNKLLDPITGALVEGNEAVAFRQIDDRIRYAQGAILVIRDFTYAMVELYPEIINKGGGQNIKIAMQELDKSCTFDPTICLRGHGDSLLADHRGKLAKHVIQSEKRLMDAMNSIKH